MKNVLLNDELIKKIDKGKMRDLVMAFPEQCKHALTIGRIQAVSKDYIRNYKNIVFLGVGGSAIGGDMIKSFLVDDCRIPIHVVRDYIIPRFIDKDTLIFANSYSGDTEETLSMYSEAKKRKAKVIAITSGGKLASLASKNNDMLIPIPKGYPPRAALGYSFIPALVMLGKLHIINDKIKDINEAISTLNKLRDEKIGLKAGNNISKKIALLIHGKFPAIYASGKLDIVVTRWRGQIAENAKALSSSHTYPEMNHNEIVGWQNPNALLSKYFIAINLRDKQDHIRVTKRMNITSSILRKAGMKVIDVHSYGKNLLSRMLSLVYIGDFISFYLSIMYRIDPTPVERISYLKAQLAKE